VKLGQALTTFETLLPPPFYKHLKNLHDNAAFSDLDLSSYNLQVKAYDSVPIAAASVAQVHKGILEDGTQVAIKVQKPEIKSQIESDLFMHWLLLQVIEIAFDIPVLYFESFIAENLRKELDFENEHRNMENARK